MEQLHQHPFQYVQLPQGMIHDSSALAEHEHHSFLANAGVIGCLVEQAVAGRAKREWEDLDHQSSNCTDTSNISSSPSHQASGNGYGNGESPHLGQMRNVGDEGAPPFDCTIQPSGQVEKATKAGSKGRSNDRKRPYPCSLCASRFGSKMELEEHQNSHTGMKPFQCEICQSRFNRRSTLWNHKRIHSDAKPFICSVCHMTFKWKNSLKCHKEMHSRKNELTPGDIGAGFHHGEPESQLLTYAIAAKKRENPPSTNKAKSSKKRANPPSSTAKRKAPRTAQATLDLELVDAKPHHSSMTYLHHQAAPVHSANAKVAKLEAISDKTFSDVGLIYEGATPTRVHQFYGNILATPVAHSQLSGHVVEPASAAATMTSGLKGLDSIDASLRYRQHLQQQSANLPGGRDLLSQIDCQQFQAMNFPLLNFDFHQQLHSSNLSTETSTSLSRKPPSPPSCGATSLSLDSFSHIGQVPSQQNFSTIACSAPAFDIAQGSPSCSSHSSSHLTLAGQAHLASSDVLIGNYHLDSAALLSAVANQRSHQSSGLCANQTSQQPFLSCLEYNYQLDQLHHSQQPTQQQRTPMSHAHSILPTDSVNPQFTGVSSFPAFHLHEGRVGNNVTQCGNDPLSALLQQTQTLVGNSHLSTNPSTIIGPPMTNGAAHIRSDVGSSVVEHSVGRLPESAESLSVGGIVYNSSHHHQ